MLHEDRLTLALPASKSDPHHCFWRVGSSWRWLGSFSLVRSLSGLLSQVMASAKVGNPLIYRYINDSGSTDSHSS